MHTKFFFFKALTFVFEYLSINFPYDIVLLSRSKFSSFVKIVFPKKSKRMVH